MKLEYSRDLNSELVQYLNIFVVYLDHQISAVYFGIKLIRQIFASEIMFSTLKT